MKAAKTAKVLGLECLKGKATFNTNINLIQHLEKGKYRCHGNRVRSSYLVLSYRGLAERGRKRRIAMRQMQGFVLHLQANVRRQREEFAEGKSGMVMFMPLDVGLPFYAKDVHSIAEELCRSAHIPPRSAGTAPAQLQTRLLTGAALCSVFWTVSAAKLVGCPPFPLTAIYMRKLELRILECTKQRVEIFNSHIVDNLPSLFLDRNTRKLKSRIANLMRTLSQVVANTKSATERLPDLEAVCTELAAPVFILHEKLSFLFVAVLQALGLASWKSYSEYNCIPFTSGTCGGLERIYGDKLADLRNLPSLAMTRVLQLEKLMEKGWHQYGDSTELCPQLSAGILCLHLCNWKRGDFSVKCVDLPTVADACA